MDVIAFVSGLWAFLILLLVGLGWLAGRDRGALASYGRVFWWLWGGTAWVTCMLIMLAHSQGAGGTYGGL